MFTWMFLSIIVATLSADIKSLKTTVSTEDNTSTQSPLSSTKNTKKQNVNKECTESEKHFIYTPCDDDGSRWKVQVPKHTKSCSISNPLPPEAGRNCSQGCNAGEYLDIRTQKCTQCEAGTYSMGDTEFIEVTNSLPESFETYGLTESTGDESCKKAGWKIKDGILMSNGSSCKSVLKYKVKLVKAGWIQFSAMSRKEDSASFHVWVENAEFCSHSFGSSEFNKEKDTEKYYTMTSHWRIHRLNMEQGENTVYFVATYFSSIFSMNTENDLAYESNKENAVTLKDISVKGFSYSLQCKKCRAGFYSKPGSSQCQGCKENTFSKEGAAVCQPCSADQYSASGSSGCTDRKPCTETDYHKIWEPCKNLMTKSKFEWNQPHICSEIKGLSLPVTGELKQCPPCNPGLESNGTACIFCPYDKYNDGQEKCTKCPPNSAPAPGLYYKFWTHFPNRPMHLYCIARPENGCKTKTGWELHDSYIGTGIGHSDDAEVLMYIAVKEFTQPFTTFKLDFEIVNCPSNNCRLKIQLIHSGHIVDDIGIYEGTTNRTSITKMRTTYKRSKFRLLFEKKYDEERQTFHYEAAELKIYSVEVSNVKNGGTKECQSCSSTKNGDCVQCDSGSYINSKDNRCVKCPANTYLESTSQSPIGKSSCKSCPEGSVSSPGSTRCHSNCYVKFTGSKDLRTYDLSALAGSHFVKGPTLFTSKGYKFFHGFHLSVCGKNDTQSLCKENATSDSKKHSNVKASICRSTFIPDNDKLISAQPIAIGDELTVIEDVTRNITKKGFVIEDHSLQFHFYAKRITEVCKSGTSGIVKFVCDPTAGGKGKIVLGDDRCTQATCDGCTYVFTWRSAHACPSCTENDYEVLNTACKDGKKSTRYRWIEPKTCNGGIEKPKDVDTTCTIFDRSLLDFKLVILGFFAGAILLAGIVIFLCYRNRSLSYKYSRLIDASQMKDGELPASEKCALDEGEDDDDEVILARTKNGKTRFLDRLKGNKKKDNFSEFETINLDSTKVFTGDEDDDEL